MEEVTATYLLREGDAPCWTIGRL